LLARDFAGLTLADFSGFREPASFRQVIYEGRKPSEDIEIKLTHSPIEISFVGASGVA